MGSRERLMREHLAAWNARDAERIASSFTDDPVYDAILPRRG